MKNKMNFQNDDYNECPSLYIGSEFLFDTCSKFHFDASLDEEAEAGFDASFEFHFDMSSKNEEAKAGHDASFMLLSEIRGDTLFLAHTHTLSLSLSVPHTNTHREHKKEIEERYRGERKK